MYFSQLPNLGRGNIDNTPGRTFSRNITVFQGGLLDTQTKLQVVYNYRTWIVEDYV